MSECKHENRANWMGDLDGAPPGPYCDDCKEFLGTGITYGGRVEPVDNFDILQSYVPEVFDGDTFYYTEILDRSKKAGNNKGRRLKTFYHRTRDGFNYQREQIIDMCEYFKARAYFRPSARSFKKVGQKFAAHLLEQAFAENWEGMRHGYSSVCGKTRLNKVWLFDFDAPGETPLSEWLMQDESSLYVPSRKGFHILTKPFDRRIADEFKEDVQIHFDNPTNLYIPDSCA